MVYAVSILHSELIQRIKPLDELNRSTLNDIYIYIYALNVSVPWRGYVRYVFG